jgi:hypothetical protein
MEVLSQAIYHTGKPTILIVNSEIKQEYLNLIRFFGPAYSANEDLTLMVDPTNIKTCDDRLPSKQEPVIFCLGFANSTQLNTSPYLKRIYLRTIDSNPLPDEKPLLKTPRFILAGLNN